MFLWSSGWNKWVLMAAVKHEPSVDSAKECPIFVYFLISHKIIEKWHLQSHWWPYLNHVTDWIPHLYNVQVSLCFVHDNGPMFTMIDAVPHATLRILKRTVRFLDSLIRNVHLHIQCSSTSSPLLLFQVIPDCSIHISESLSKKSGTQLDGPTFSHNNHTWVQMFRDECRKRDAHPKYIDFSIECVPLRTVLHD